MVLTSTPPTPREQPAVGLTEEVPAPTTSEPSPAPGPPTQTQAGPEGSELPEQLRQLADLHRVGALTDEQFDRAKQRLLAG